MLPKRFTKPCDMTRVRILKNATRDVVRHGGTNAKMTVSTENSHFLVNYSHLD
jgi:hypothetical protein